MRKIRINGIIIKAGQHRLVELKIARLPSGTEIHLPLYIFRSKVDGPAVLFSGGLHGDEVNGIETVRRMLRDRSFENILRGTVIAIPIINVYGFLNFSREMPDGKDINRTFPGNPDGSLASLVAHTVSSQILPNIDLGVDLHTGGASRTNYPQVRFAEDDLFAAELAKQFNAPISLTSNVIDGSIRQQARKLGKSWLVFEAGESLRFDEHAIEEGMNGILRILKHQGMIETAPEQEAETNFIKKSTWVRAPSAGLFRFIKQSGEQVAKDEIIGKIADPFNIYEFEIKAPESGLIEERTERTLARTRQNPVVRFSSKSTGKNERH